MRQPPDISTVHNVTSLHGGPVLTPTPNESCIAFLRDMLEKAESGEITGFVAASLHGDGLASYTIAGMIGPYALLGGLEMANMGSYLHH